MTLGNLFWVTGMVDDPHSLRLEQKRRKIEKDNGFSFACIDF